MNLTAAKVLVDQLSGDDQLAKNLQDNQNVEMFRLFCLISKTLYISTQVSSKSPQTTRQMDCFGTLPQLEKTQSTVSPTICWTDADSLTVEQICKDLGIMEMELDVYGSASGPATSGRTAHAGSSITQTSCRPKEEKQTDKEEEGGQ